MRIVRNTPYRSAVAPFHGIDNPFSWTLDSPAVFSEVAVEELGLQAVRVPGSINYTGSERYLLMLAMGGVEYSISRRSDHGVNLAFSLYDYVNTPRSELASGSGTPEFAGTASYGAGQFMFTPETTRYLLARITPATESDVFDPLEADKTTTVTVFPAPQRFDWSSKSVIDWAHRIDGRSWSSSGRLNHYRSLSDMREYAR